MSTVSNKPQHGDTLLDREKLAANGPFQEFLDDLTELTNSNFTDIELLKELIEVNIDDYRITERTRLEAGSQLTQSPPGLDLPQQINFGPAQSNEYVDLDVNGTLTFKVVADLIARIRLNVGRNSNNGEARVLIRALVDGVQIGNPVDAVIDSARIVIPLTFTRTIGIVPGAKFSLEFYRDSAGVNEGDLVSITSGIGWGTSTSANIILEEFLLEKKENASQQARGALF